MWKFFCFVGSSCEIGIREEKYDGCFVVIMVKLFFEEFFGEDFVRGIFIDEDIMNILLK